ncbi:MAG TPA: chromate efflux transporter [Geminicoccaceae bacterium]|nr:chromate efflux transporter [Geminicoccaceae bacterium]
MTAAHPEQGAETRRERLREVGAVFHRLGWTSFGGPAAHLVYFRDEFVVRRRWMDERAFAEQLALCQLLPGPASSQLGILLGLGRAGLAGGLLAWAGFTLPSALLMLAFAYLAGLGGAVSDGWLHGLKVVVVGVVAQAVLSMSRTLCPDWPRRALALLGAAGALALPGATGQLIAIGLGGAIGWLALRDEDARDVGAPPRPISRRAAVACLALSLGLLAALPLLRAVAASPTLAVIDSFYRAGALVFGGGHVVLPLLEAEVVRPGWIGPEAFLAGYGAAQALPGPLFAFSAYLGAAMDTPLRGPLGALLCLLVLYLPSTLLLLGVLPFWGRLRALRGMSAALAGVGAAVVGLLLAVLIHPIWPSAIDGPADVALALAAFALLATGRFPAWAVVIGCAAVGAVLPVLLGR